MLLERNGVIKIGRLQMEQHVKNMEITIGAKEVPKEAEKVIMVQAGKRSGSTLKNGHHRPNMGQEELLWFAHNADAVVFGCRNSKVSLSGRN